MNWFPRRAKRRVMAGTNTLLGLPQTLTAAEVRELLGGVSRKTMRRYTLAGRLSPIRVNSRRLLYRTEDIINLLRDGGKPESR